MIYDTDIPLRSSKDVGLKNVNYLNGKCYFLNVTWPYNRLIITKLVI